MTLTAYIEDEVKHNKLSRELVTELKKATVYKGLQAV